MSLNTRRIEGLSPSTDIGFRALICAARLLRDYGGYVPRSRLFEEIPGQVEMTENDLEEAADGTVRWQRQIGFHALDAKQAGIIDMDRRKGWRLLPRGFELLDTGDAQSFFDVYWSVRIARNRARMKKTR